MKLCETATHAPALPAGPRVTPPPPPPPAPPLPEDDRALLALVAGGDRHALEALYTRHAGWLAARLDRRCDDAGMVDEALQDTFLAVWRSAGTFRGEGDVGAWLWGIALRRLLDQLRRRRPEPVDPATFGLGGLGGGSAAGGAAPDAEAEAFAATVGGELAEAFRHLDPDLRAVLLVTAVDGLTTKEAAVLLGIPQGTVKTRLARARARLQEVLA